MSTIETATLGGGCFWCMEAVFDDLQGVIDVVSGYSNGNTSNPDYREVCSGESGHAEVIQVTFDNSVISFAEILEVFFAVHDPTTLNRQGNDTGTQYRSGIYVHTDKQARIARETIEKLNAAQVWDVPIVTEITKAETFYAAEEYHQQYFARNPTQGYCLAVVSPKVAKFRQKFVHRLKAKV